MLVINSRGTDVRKTKNRGLRRSGAMAVLMTSVMVFAGACGSDDDSSGAVASVDSGDEAKTDPTSKGDPTAYAKCMRENGIPEFPDPESEGAITLPKGVDPKSAEFKEAEKQCKQHMPSGLGKPEGKDQWSSADKLKYAKCMRENGLPKFPDPDADADGFLLGQGSGVDPKSSQFKKADEACTQYKPQNKGSTSNLGAQ